MIDRASGGRLIAYFLLPLINNKRFGRRGPGFRKWIVDAAADVSTLLPGSRRLIHQLASASSMWPSDYSSRARQVLPAGVLPDAFQTRRLSSSFGSIWTVDIGWIYSKVE